MAFVACPQCGSKQLRVSKTRGFGEGLRSILGILEFRCRQCESRFTGAIWNFSGIRYARCPKCLRMDLNTWSEQYYNPTRKTIVLLRLGATPYRCESCRCNFASFRACKERYAWRRPQEEPQRGESR